MCNKHKELVIGISSSSMDNYNSDEVKTMIRAKSIMDRIPETEQSVEYKTIIQMIQTFLHDNCQHEIVIDNIDVTPDKSVTIFYCKHCTESLDTIPSSRYDIKNIRVVMPIRTP